jgi:hypothetical protein
MVSNERVAVRWVWVERFINTLKEGGIPHEVQGGIVYVVAPCALLTAINWTDFTRAAMFERLQDFLHGFASSSPDADKFEVVYKAVQQAMDDLSTAEMPKETA